MCDFFSFKINFMARKCMHACQILLILISNNMVLNLLFNNYRINRIDINMI